MSYRIVTLIDVCHLITDGVHAKPDYKLSGVPFISVKDMVSGKLNLSKTKFISTEDHAKFTKRCKPENADILYSKVGSYGVACLVDTHQEFSLYVSVCLIKPDKKVIDPLYLKYLLNSSLVRRQADKLVKGIGVPDLHLIEIKKFKIPLPPLDEQKRIATILDKADALREKRRQAIAKLDTLLKSVFLDMFGDPVTNPKKLQTKPIEEFGSVTTGNTPPRSNPEFYGTTLEWIKSDNINSPLHILTEAEEKLSQKGRNVGRIVPARSVLVTCIAGSPECIGNVALTDREVAFNQQINAIAPNSNTNSYFLYTQLLLGKRLVQRASTNSMKGMVNKNSFSKIRLLAPSINLQNRFGLWFEQFMDLCKKNNDAIGKADKLFQSLQQRAFNGELFNNDIEELKALAEVSANV